MPCLYTKQGKDVLHCRLTLCCGPHQNVNMTIACRKAATRAHLGVQIVTSQSSNANLNGQKLGERVYPHHLRVEFVVEKDEAVHGP